MILLSNPSKQYTHQTAKALADSGKDMLFVTAYWYRPKRWFEQCITALIPSLKKQLLKKSFNGLPVAVIRDHWRGILFSFVGRFLYGIEKRSFVEDRLHDRWAARLVKQYHPLLVIGYEKSCLQSFTAAKQNNSTTILDLAQVHVSFIEQLREQYPFFRQNTGNDILFEQVKAIKLQEYDLAKEIWVLSDFAKQAMIDNGIAENKLRKLSLGFDHLKFTLKETYSTKETLQLIFVGTVNYRKGIHLLLNYMQSTALSVHLTIVGPLGEGINTAMLQLPTITYHSFVQHDALVQLLHAADVFVFPSYLDSWAMVVIEAMACGLPVIVTEHTGAKEAVNEGSGFIIPVDNEPVLKEAIEYFYNHRDEIERMGKAAHTSVKKYSWEQYHNRVNELVGQHL